MLFRTQTKVGVVLFALMASNSMLLGASVTVVPPGLSPGDHYRLVFVTSAQRSAEAFDIAEYDAFVNTTANAAGSLIAKYNFAWMAIGSTFDVSARDHIGTFPSTPVFRLDGLRIADNDGDLWDESIQNPIGLDEHGNAAPPFQHVLTGTRSDGTSSEFPLGGGAKHLVLTGGSDYTDYRWIAGFGGSRTDVLPLYAISEELIVPNSVPEPQTVVTVLGGIIVLARVRRRVS